MVSKGEIEAYIAIARPSLPNDRSERGFAVAMVRYYEDAVHSAELMKKHSSGDLNSALEGVLASHRRDLRALKSWLASGPAEAHTEGN